jgi:hypothetical protein
MQRWSDALYRKPGRSELNARRAYEQSVVSQQLRSGGAAKRRKAETARQVGPVTVRVLSSVQAAAASASARAFLKQRLYGAGVRRSGAMLEPTKAHGIFVHPPRSC